MDNEEKEPQAESPQAESPQAESLQAESPENEKPKEEDTPSSAGADDETADLKASLAGLEEKIDALLAIVNKNNNNEPAEEPEKDTSVDSLESFEAL